jgi:microcystin-dependent protein
MISSYQPGKKRDCNGSVNPIFETRIWLQFDGAAKGGKATTGPGRTGGVEQTIVQGENPAQVTSQGQETVRVRSYTLPTGSRIEETRVESDATGLPVTNFQAVVVNAPMPVVKREGPAQRQVNEGA